MTIIWKKSIENLWKPQVTRQEKIGDIDVDS